MLNVWNAVGESNGMVLRRVLFIPSALNGINHL